MDRRSVLKALAATAGGFLLNNGLSASQNTGQARTKYNSFGWREDKKSLDDFIRRHEYPYVSQLSKHIKGTGEGKATYLHTALESVTGHKYQCRDQGAPDCVSQAFSSGVDILTAVQVALMRMPQRWAGFCASEPIYGGSRVEIGGYNGTGGGSTGHWGAEWLSRYGVLLMQVYPGGYDFTRYDPEKANEYGRSGCPDALEPLAKLHPVKRTAICKTYSELRDCINNGCPVIVCSNVGFGDGVCERDSEGFLIRKRRPWYHAMLFPAYDDTYKRPGALCFNSWGNRWVYGPIRGPQPEGTFWIDADTVDVMLGQGDSFAISGFVGFPRLNIPPYILR